MTAFVCMNVVVGRFLPDSVYTNQLVWGLVAFLVLAIGDGYWICQVQRILRSTRTPPIKLVYRDDGPEKIAESFYRCDYANPFFMKSPWPGSVSKS